jgi:hypothetical protein
VAQGIKKKATAAAANMLEDKHRALRLRMRSYHAEVRSWASCSQFPVTEKPLPENHELKESVLSSLRDEAADPLLSNEEEDDEMFEDLDDDPDATIDSHDPLYLCPEHCPIWSPSHDPAFLDEAVRQQELAL